MLNGKSDSKYPFEFIGEGEHERPYSKMKKPTLYSYVGIWENQLDSDSVWIEPIFRFKILF
jgi:hypothetical protein